MKIMKPIRMTLPIIAFVFLLGITSTSWADFTGSINYNNGLYAYDDNWTNPATTLSWHVFQRTDGHYEYDYTFTLPSNAKNISHVILQTSSNFTNADMLSGTTANGQLGTWDGQGNSNLGIPAPLYGIKWDTSATPVTSFNWTIITDRVPTFGNFYAKDGNSNGGTYAYRGTQGQFGDNVLVPDTVPTPIAAAAWLFGSGLVGLVGIRTRSNT